jgi:hypothetical protein
MVLGTAGASRRNQKVQNGIYELHTKSEKSHFRFNIRHFGVK